MHRPTLVRVARLRYYPFVPAVLAWLCCAAVLANDRFEPIELGRVQVGGEIGRRIDVTANNNLLVIDVAKDFLHPFATKDRSSGYIGLGKLIDSLARMAAYNGDPKLIDRKNEVITAAITLQEPDGYLGLMAPQSRMWELWDVHEMGYLVYGLSSDYRLFDNQASLKAARKLADYILARWMAEPDRELGEDIITTHMAATGLERAFLLLSEQSGDPKYRQFCVRNRKLPEWNLDIVRGRWGRIEGHAYAFMAHALAQTQLNRSQPDEKLLVQERKVLDFLCGQNGLVITGACGDHECWHDTQQGTTNLGETCATAYLLRVLDDCLRREGDSRCGDIMERVTTQVPCADFFDARDDALRAHATQIDPNGFFFAVPLEWQQRLWPTEEFELAQTRVQTAIPEHDLFAGIEQP